MLKNYHFNAHQLLTDDEHSELKTKWTKDLDDSSGVGWRLSDQQTILNCACPLVIDEIKTIFCYQEIEIPKRYQPVNGSYVLPRKNTYKEVEFLSNFDIKHYDLKRLLRQVRKEIYLPHIDKKALNFKNSSILANTQEIISNIADLRAAMGMPFQPIKLGEAAKSVAIVDRGFTVGAKSELSFWTGHGDKVRGVISQIAPGAEIQTFDIGPNGTSATILIGIIKAIKSGTLLINISQSVKESQANQRTVAFAKKNEALIVCAISNDGAPASALSQCEGVVSVHIDSKIPFRTGKPRIDCLTPLFSLGGFTGDSAAAALVSAMFLIFRNKTGLIGDSLISSFLERCKTNDSFTKFPPNFFQE